jgi:hypothetical protein
MRLTPVLALVPLLAAAMPQASRERSPVERRAPGADLFKRDCDYNGCQCAPGYVGVFCANCPSNGWFVVEELGYGGSTSHVYQCDGSGGCCDYGYAEDCAYGATGRCG